MFKGVGEVIWPIKDDIKGCDLFEGLGNGIGGVGPFGQEGNIGDKEGG